MRIHALTEAEIIVHDEQCEAEEREAEKLREAEEKRKAALRREDELRAAEKQKREAEQRREAEARAAADWDDVQVQYAPVMRTVDPSSDNEEEAHACTGTREEVVDDWDAELE